MIKSGGLVQIQDEGILQGFVKIINFVGASVSATVSANVATITLTGGVATQTNLAPATNQLIVASYCVYATDYYECVTDVETEIAVESVLEIG